MKFLSVLLLVLLAFTSCSTTKVDSQIMVSGRCELEIDPDMATLSIGVNERGETTKEAQENVNVKLAAVLSILKDEYKIDKNDIKTTNMSVYPEYSWIDGKQVLIGQKASQSIEVTIRNLPLISSIFDDLTEVSGINISNINLDSSKKSEYLSLARKFATDDARKRADDYSANQSLKSGRVISITEKGFDGSRYAIPVNSTAAKSLAMEDAIVESDYHFSKISVSAEVDVVFELESNK